MAAGRRKKGSSGGSACTDDEGTPKSPPAGAKLPVASKAGQPLSSVVAVIVAGLVGCGLTVWGPSLRNLPSQLASNRSSTEPTMHSMPLSRSAPLPPAQPPPQPAAPRLNPSRVPADEPQCRNFCTKKTHGWEEMCTWSGCGACTSCDVPEEDPPRLTFAEIFRNAGINATSVRRVQAWSDELFDWNMAGDGFEPIIIEGAAAAWPALEKWKQTGYLLSEVEMLSPVVHISPTPYMRGTNVKRTGDPDLIFGDKAAPPHEHRFTGLFDISSQEQLLKDIEPLPSFLREDGGLPYTSSSTRSCLWASNAEYVDSGLHWDQNSGGFLTQVVGTKDIVLFPLMDTEFLYMRTDRGHHFESSLYMFRDLRPEHQEDHPMARRIDARPCERVCPTSLSLPSTSL